MQLDFFEPKQRPSFHNSVPIHGKELIQAERNAKAQEARVLTIFQETGRDYNEQTTLNTSTPKLRHKARPSGCRLNMTALFTSSPPRLAAIGWTWCMTSTRMKR